MMRDEQILLTHAFCNATNVDSAPACLTNLSDSARAETVAYLTEHAMAAMRLFIETLDLHAEEVRRVQHIMSRYDDLNLIGEDRVTVAVNVLLRLDGGEKS